MTRRHVHPRCNADYEDAIADGVTLLYFDKWPNFTTAPNLTWQGCTDPKCPDYEFKDGIQ